MRHLLLTLRFDGSEYHGWQVQSNGITVQQQLQDAIEGTTGVRSGVTGCSRTDAGVHANMYCCGFFTESTISCDKLILALNAWLPDDIAVYGCREVDDSFHPRYSCLSKEYIYKIWNSPYRNPFCTKRYLNYKYPLDAKLLDDEAKDFVGTHDFRAFVASGGKIDDTVRTVKSANVSRIGDEVIFSVEADGFLYNMVRIMTGTLLDIASGKLPHGGIGDIILSCDRTRAGITAPPDGLYLNRVIYDNTVQ